MKSNRIYSFGSLGITTWFLLTLAFCGINSVLIRFTSVNRTNEGMPYYCAFCACSYTDGISKLYTNCTNKGLYLPLDKNTTEFVLRRSSLYRVRSLYFRGLENLEVLDLSDNRITKIYEGAFKDLHNLKTLLLEGNDFTSLQASLRPGVFAGLTNLTVLTLHRCIERGLTIASVVVSETFSDLVSLEYLSMDGIFRMEFDERFRKLKNLKTLVLSGDQGTCEIQYLTNETFYGLENLENLTVANCEVKSIHRETFSTMRSLQYLDLSRNFDIKMVGLADIAYGLAFTNVTVLKINSIHNPLRAGSEILKSDVRNFRDLQLRELYMDENGIEYVDLGVFSNLPDTIKFLSLRKNKMLFGFYLSEIIFNNPGLEVLDATDQDIMTRTYPSTRVRQRYKEIADRKKGPRSLAEDGGGRRNKRSAFLTVPVVISLKTLKCSGSMSNVAFADFNGTTNNITYMDLSRNFLPLLRGHEFLGLPELRFLNLSNNYIEQVFDRSIFRELTQLEVLDLKNNLLGNELEADMPLFGDLKNLLHLNLSMNRIHAIAEYAFDGLYKLETLDLSDNYLTNVYFDMSHLDSLRDIDLSNNRLHSLSIGARNTLDQIAKTKEVWVNLRANDFACNCETIPFLRWLLESPVIFVDFDQYYCSLNNGSIRYLNASVTLVGDLEEECRSYLILIVGCATGGSFLVAFVLSYSVYRNRWKLRYLYYMAKVKIDKHKDEHMNYHFDFDAFLSYADPDREFIIKDVVEKLEKAEGIRLCIRDRDFEIGEVVAVNISKAIRTSKKTMLIVSRHFLKSKWCNFEMNMARMEAIHMKRKVLAVIFLEEVPANALPIELIDILRECPNTDLPDEENTKPAFWQTCLGFLKD